MGQIPMYIEWKGWTVDKDIQHSKNEISTSIISEIYKTFCQTHNEGILIIWSFLK